MDAAMPGPINYSLRFGWVFIVAIYDVQLHVGCLVLRTIPE